MIFSVAFYFLLPIGAAYFPDLYSIKVWGPINVGLLFALSQFIVAWGIAFYYSKRANAEFDAMADATLASRVREESEGRDDERHCSSAPRQSARRPRRARPARRLPALAQGAVSTELPLAHVRGVRRHHRA